MRIENIERLNPLFARADVEVEGKWFENVMIAKRRGHYAVVILKGQKSREIPVPENLTEQLRPYFGHCQGLHEGRFGKGIEP